MKDIDSDGSDAADAFQVGRCDLSWEDFALFMARSLRSLKLSTKGLLATGSYVQLYVVACCLFERWFDRIPDSTLPIFQCTGLLRTVTCAEKAGSTAGPAGQSPSGLL